MDEKLVHRFDLETKHVMETIILSALEEISICSCHWQSYSSDEGEGEGNLFVACMPKRQAITYTDVIPKVRKAIKEKRCGTLFFVRAISKLEKLYYYES